MAVPFVITRRSLLGGIGALLAAPAIVRAASLMPVSVWTPPVATLAQFTGWGWARKLSVVGFDAVGNPRIESAAISDREWTGDCTTIFHRLTYISEVEVSGDLWRHTWIPSPLDGFPVEARKVTIAQSKTGYVAEVFGQRLEKPRLLA